MNVSNLKRAKHYKLFSSEIYTFFLKLSTLLKMISQLIGCFIPFLIFSCAAGEETVSDSKPLHLLPKIDFHEEITALIETEIRNVSFGISWEIANDTDLEHFVKRSHETLLVSVRSKDPGILEIVNVFYPSCIRFTGQPLNFSFLVRGIFLGYTKVEVDLTILPNGCIDSNTVEDRVDMGAMIRQFELLASVIRQPSVMVNIVTGIFTVLVAINFINMGVQLDIQIILKVLKKPIGPAIGFICQFLFMPLVAYGICIALLENESLRLGLFTLGCSPGGSMSNFWTLLFDGDVNLSIAMTFISTVAALGMMPLWIFTLGSTITKEREATIPYGNLAGSLIGLTLPITLGLLIQRYSPKLTRFSNMIIKPFTIIICLVGVGLACYVNQFIFFLFTWRVVLAGLLISWGGYCFGALAAWMSRLGRAQIIAISIETAFQNPAVAFVLLLLSLPQPDADLATVPIVAQLFLTGIPMWILLLATRIYRKIRKCYGETEVEKIEVPEIDTIQRAYAAVATVPPEEKGLPLKPRWI